MAAIPCSGYVYCACPACTAEVSPRMKRDLETLKGLASQDGKPLAVYRHINFIMERIRNNGKRPS